MTPEIIVPYFIQVIIIGRAEVQAQRYEYVIRE